MFLKSPRYLKGGANKCCRILPGRGRLFCWGNPLWPNNKNIVMKISLKLLSFQLKTPIKLYDIGVISIIMRKYPKLII